ncbi:LysR family transcriptional regulator [Acidovorax sp. SUPP950]|uniref:LysR family transcriptional regulator n=1 Tax=Acidovorax sp. SUPP950 TaxID=511901 RepID=UPI0023C534BF|nr:LysR substrate-binding domain-containing protein [Acidovorax sp. SUPP950]GKS77846.1 LysR family transcriptional regulator [Acidovorax sp. SUPP950]
MELRQLRAVLTLAEEGHFGKAAERLNIVPSALSMQIRQLEEELGGPLFHRTTRRVDLTDAGSTLVLGARALVEQTTSLRDEVRRRLRGELGRIRIGFTGSQGVTGQMKQHIRAFHMRYPDVDLILREMGPVDQYEAIRQRDLDLGYTARLTPALPEPLIVHRAWPMDWQILMATDHPLASEAVVHPRMLAHQTFVTYAGQASDLLYAHPLARLLGTMPVKMVRANSAMAVLSHVATGLAITIVPSFEMDAQLPGLVSRPVDRLGPVLDLVMISHMQLDSPAVQLFIDSVDHEELDDAPK